MIRFIRFINKCQFDVNVYLLPFFVCYIVAKLLFIFDALLAAGVFSFMTHLVFTVFALKIIAINNLGVNQTQKIQLGLLSFTFLGGSVFFLWFFVNYNCIFQVIGVSFCQLKVMNIMFKLKLMRNTLSKSSVILKVKSSTKFISLLLFNFSVMFADLVLMYAFLITKNDPIPIVVKMNLWITLPTGLCVTASFIGYNRIRREMTKNNAVQPESPCRNPYTATFSSSNRKLGSLTQPLPSSPSLNSSPSPSTSPPSP